MSEKVQTHIGTERGSDLSSRVHYSEYGKLSNSYLTLGNYELDNYEPFSNILDIYSDGYRKMNELIIGECQNSKKGLPGFIISGNPFSLNYLYRVVQNQNPYIEGTENIEVVRTTSESWEELAPKSYDRLDLFRKNVLNISKTLSFYRPKSPLEELIEKSTNTLKNLQYDWDEEGALTIDAAILHSATSFLKRYYAFISISYNLSIDLPEINPCKDGTVDLEWHTPHAQLLINFRKDEEGNVIAYYYGDRHNNKMQVKGSTPVNEFSEHLAVWMKFLR